MGKLFTPLRMGPLTIKNRFMMAPMANGLADASGYVNERFIRFFEERAMNETGIIMLGSMRISKKEKRFPGQVSVNCDRFLPGLVQLTKTIHQAGSLIGAQLYEAGRYTSNRKTDMEPNTTSSEPKSMVQSNLEILSEREMKEIKYQFVTAARRCVRAGFDLVELQFGHGDLFHNFLSPRSNKRTDEYGGRLTNRMRFPFEVLQEVIHECGKTVAVTIRISVDEFAAGGLKFNEVLEICQEAEKAGVHAISISAGSCDSLEYMIQPMFIKKGLLIPYSRKLKEKLGIPVIVSGRLNEATIIKQIINQGNADMVAIGRGLVADEEMITKIRRERMEDIRGCIACNECVNQVLKGKGIQCLINARAGFEINRLIQETKLKRRVVIIGAGPAGMEAARIAAMRGHEVILIDRKNEAGGKLDIVAAPPGKSSYFLYKKYLLHQLAQLKVSFIHQNIQSVKDIEPYKPDYVIVATGAHQLVPSIDRLNLTNVRMSEEVLNGAAVGERVAIIGGGLVGSETAQFLAIRGKQVIIIEEGEKIAKEIGFTFVNYLFDFFKEYQVQLITNATIQAVEENKIVLDNQTIRIDTIVIAREYEPNHALINKLRDKYQQVYTIGDVNEPRKILQATKEAFLVASSI